MASKENIKNVSEESKAPESKKRRKNRPEQVQNENIIELDSVSKIYSDGSIALENINLKIRGGEFVSFIGPSGAGKSTLFKLVYAEENPSGGSIYFCGSPLEDISRRKLPFHRRKIGVVFQDSKLLPKKTVFENVAYALEVIGESKKEIEENVPQILGIVGLAKRSNAFPNQLSSGEQQKAAMARALIHRPMIILADEPTGNLDPASSLEIIELLLKINELGTTVLLASHDKAIVDKACRRVISLNKGRMIDDVAKGKYNR